eukprot:TRINITY_DN33619_c0_g1_i1.p1 TRINITY_DN33619_c0_g1~~TRINITY_DN33619_c0_g1_i1.p1  ORF type:complete len:111 (+),score=17.42 TRINITY_DN33619_c0_g1_i1:36-368(+)
MAASAVRNFVKGQLGESVSKAHVLVFSKSYCPYCSRVKGLFEGAKPASYSVVEIDQIPNGGAIQSELQKLTGQRTVPNVIIGDRHIGGCDDTFALQHSNELSSLLTPSKM